MQRSKFAITTLLIMTLGLMAALFYLGILLTRPTEKPSPIAPVRTKATSITYGKLIALNQTEPTVTPIATSTSIPTPTSISPTVRVSISPTEIVLAYASPTSASSSPTIAASASAAATKSTSLPATGYITNTLIIFGAASLLIFFSFLF